MSAQDHFILLCSEKRQLAYAEVIAAANFPVEVVHSPEEALAACVRKPPLALIVDTVTGMRSGNANTSLLALYNLELSWPVLRGTAKKNEAVTVLSTSSQISAPFCEGLAAVAANSPQWNTQTSRRRFIRQRVQCRSRAQLSGTPDWSLGTILDLSGGGCFVVSFAPLPIESSLTIEILDLVDSPIMVSGRVVWNRLWEDGTELPGMGIQFDAESVPLSLIDALSKCLL